MKIRIDHVTLLSALNDCDTVAEIKSPYLWGSCVIIEAGGQGLRLRAGNGLQNVARNTPTEGVTVVKPGGVMVTASDIVKRIAALDPGEVTIEELPGSVRISQASTKFTLPKFDPTTAPEFVNVEPQGSEVDARALAAVLARVSPAMGYTESQATTYGVGLVTMDGKLWCKAMNGQVGAMAPLTFDGEICTIIPAPAVEHLRKALAEIDGVARIAVVDRSIHVFADGFAYSTLVAADKFPPLEQAIPARSGDSFQVDRSAALSAIKVATIGGIRDQKLRLRVSGEGVTFRGEERNVPGGARLVTCDCTAPSWSMAADYVKALFAFANGDTVTVWHNKGSHKLDGGPGPMTIEEDGALFVAMPLKYDAIDLAPDAAEWT